MYRDQIKVLDCTIRNGGLINNHYFTDEFVNSVYRALTKSGIDYMIPMRKGIEWGCIIPCMVTGILNEHPRSAIAYRKTDDRDKFAELYEQMRETQE